MLTRANYIERRFEILASMISIGETVGLELGACDLPTVPSGQGNCRYADFRSAEEMAELWQIPVTNISPVHYVVSRQDRLSSQIRDQFDYVIACHVLEHVPNVIDYLNELRSVLRPGAGRLIFLTIPDKRATPDATRPTTTINHLLMDYYDDCRYPTLEHILEFHCHWVGNADKTGPLSIKDAYPYATEYYETGLADAHCHVWTGEEFFEQITQLIDASFLPGLAVARFAPMTDLNEFTLVLMTTGEEGIALPKRRTRHRRPAAT